MVLSIGGIVIDLSMPFVLVALTFSFNDNDNDDDDNTASVVWRWSIVWLLAVMHLVFHGTNAVLLSHIGAFPLLSCVLATLFLPPDWPNRTLPWRRQLPRDYSAASSHCEPNSRKPSRTSMRSLRQRKLPSHPTHPSTFEPTTREAAIDSQPHPSSGTHASTLSTLLVATFIVAFLVLQTLYLPNRSLAIKPHSITAPDVMWHQRGFLFSWRMMSVYDEVPSAEMTLAHHESNATFFHMSLLDPSFLGMLDSRANAFVTRLSQPHALVWFAHQVADVTLAITGSRPRVYLTVRRPTRLPSLLLLSSFLDSPCMRSRSPDPSESQRASTAAALPNGRRSSGARAVRVESRYPRAVAQKEPTPLAPTSCDVSLLVASAQFTFECRVSWPLRATRTGI